MRVLAMLLVVLGAGCEFPEQSPPQESHQSASCFMAAQPPGQPFNEAAYLRCLHGNAAPELADAGADATGAAVEPGQR